MLDELLVRQRLVGPEIARERALLVRRRRRDHVPAAKLRDLRQQLPDAAGRCVHDHAIPGPDRIRVVREVVSGHSLQQHGDGKVGGDAVGNAHRLGARHGDLLRVAVRHGAPDETLSFRRHATRLGADHRRWVDAVVLAGSFVDVAVVDADSLDVHEHLAVTGNGLRHVADLEHVRAA